MLDNIRKMSDQSMSFQRIFSYASQNIFFLQSFGIAEGGRVIEMKNMAKAAGQPLPEFTPPEGETMEQVKLMALMSKNK